MKISQFKSALQLAKPDAGLVLKTTCLAPGHCGIPNELLPLDMQAKTSCSPGSGCC